MERQINDELTWRLNTTNGNFESCNKYDIRTGDIVLQFMKEGRYNSEGYSVYVVTSTWWDERGQFCLTYEDMTMRWY